MLNNKTFLLLLIFSIIYAVYGGSTDGETYCEKRGSGSNKGRLVGGNEARQGSWPFMVSLLIDFGFGTGFNHSCAGSIINEYQVLTAAHCFTKGGNEKDSYDGDPDNWMVMAGKVKRTLPDDKSWERDPEKYNLHRVKEITVHGGFLQKIWMNDIAIITVKKPFKFSRKIGRGKLPKKNHSIEFDPTYDDPEKGVLCQVAGWGHMDKTWKGNGINPIELMEACVPIVNTNECRNNYFMNQLEDRNISTFPDMKQKIDYQINTVYQGMTICAGSEETDSCVGDSGGPLTCWQKGAKNWKWRITGIVSSGPKNQCAVKDLPGTFMKVQHFRYWIDEQEKKVKDNLCKNFGKKCKKPKSSKKSKKKSGRSKETKKSKKSKKKSKKD